MVECTSMIGTQNPNSFSLIRPLDSQNTTTIVDEYLKDNYLAYHKTTKPLAQPQNSKAILNHYIITQKIEALNGGSMSTMEVRNPYRLNHNAKSVHIVSENGAFNRIVYKNGKFVKKLYYEIEPAKRKIATNGLNAKLQKIALKIGQGANGCERPVLRRFAGLLFNMAKKRI